MEKDVVNKSLQVDGRLSFYRKNKPLSHSLLLNLVARTCNLIFIVLDVLKPLGHKRLIEYELEGFGIRLNKEPPNIYFKRKDKGGLNYQALVPQTSLDLETVKAILGEYKIHNAVSLISFHSINEFHFVVVQKDIILRCDATEDDIIDLIEGNRIYIPAIYVLNKIDQISIEELDIIYKIPHCVPISAHHKWNFDDLLEKLWTYLKLVRIYTKPKGQLPDYSAPVVLIQGKSSVEDFCNKIHRAILQDFKYALVWVNNVQYRV